MSRKLAWKHTWAQCYDYFGVRNREFDVEIASLRLAYYLASFGMFRASGQTRTLQLEDFSRLVNICREYSSLRDQGTRFLLRNLDRVLDFTEALRVETCNLNVSPTDTLISKIALATTASMPAYDRYAVAALRDHGIVGCPSRRGLSQIYALSRKELKTFGLHSKSSLPIMRALDVALMERGKRLIGNN